MARLKQVPAPESCPGREVAVDVVFLEKETPSELSMARLEERARLLKAKRLTDEALLAVACSRTHARLVDLYLEALREIEDSIDANVRAGLGAKASHSPARIRPETDRLQR